MACQLRHWIQLIFKRKTRDCAFYRLPVEIIQEIATYLPTSASASLVLTSRSMRYILGQHILEKLRTEGDERHLFLSLLDKDLPKHFYCDECQNLHPVFGTEGPFKSSFRRKKLAMWEMEHRDRLKCLKRDPLFGMKSLKINSYEVLQKDVCLALKRHHYGATYGIHLATFLGHERKAWIVSIYQARIISDELFIHWETRAKIMPGTRAEIIPRRVEPRWAEPFGVCIHLRNNLFPSKDRDWDMQRNCAPPDSFFQHYQCVISHSAGKDCVICSGVKQCPACFMEYTINKQGENTVRVSAWFNLGTGRSEDKKWRSHIESISNNSRRWQPVSFPPGSIYEAWKQEESKVRTGRHQLASYLE